MVMTSMAMPPKDGMAMGTMMSDPRPVEVSTGSRARRVVAVGADAAISDGLGEGKWQNNEESV